MFTLYRASKQCMNMMNYMMCFFCSPDQFIWYRQNHAIVCSNFCNDVYQNCKTAEYDGKKIGQSFQNGHEFCLAQDFIVSDTNHQCFDFDPTPFSHASRLNTKYYTFRILFLFFMLFFL